MTATDTEVGTWQIDPAHSVAAFSVKHLMISTVRGSFGTLNGTITIDETHPHNSSVDATIDAASITTGDANRDTHLRSPDFFDVDTHPTLTFKSTKVEHVSDDEYRVTGDLTMHGVTQESVLDLTFEGSTTSPFNGKPVAGFTATTSINRKDFGLTWNAALESGGVMVSDKVKVELHIEAGKQ